MRNLKPETVMSFIDQCRTHDGVFSSTPGGEKSLYGTLYALSLKYYLTGKTDLSGAHKEFLLSCQDKRTGYFIGPETDGFEPDENAKHNLEHIHMHLTSAALPVIELFQSCAEYPLTFALPFTDIAFLDEWLSKRNWEDAWLEGNNLLFILQFLVYLREKEKKPTAQKALEYLFKWLDKQMDPASGLWGTNGFCSPFVAMCGGYHQLLAYYSESHPIPYPLALIDTTLSLQHIDGGFSPYRGGGACEDADAVDILVNLYKRVDYRHPQVRHALRRSLKHLLNLQNIDGGFPYKKRGPFIHLGIPATQCNSGESNMFSTWFRVHTIALIAEILTDEPSINDIHFYFNPTLSMGWHKPWEKAQQPISIYNRVVELLYLPCHLQKLKWVVSNIGVISSEAIKMIVKRIMK